MKFISIKNYYYSFYHNSKILPFQLDNKKLDDLDLSDFDNDLVPFVKQYFYLKSGIEHYRLLANISTYFNNKTLLDIGTFKGGSALALSYNKSNNVISSSLEIAMKGKLDLSSTKLCNFLKDSISKERRGPMPIVNS